jgi:hypothetical protein
MALWYPHGSAARATAGYRRRRQRSSEDADAVAARRANANVARFSETRDDQRIRSATAGRIRWSDNTCTG